MSHTWYTAYVDRHFDSASADLARLIKKNPDAIQLYVYRAKSQYYLKQFDSATATLSAAIGQIEKRDTTKLLPAYISREMLTYSIAMANAQAQHDSAAKATFQLVVTQNLGFHMAHLHLASQALNAHDTATAINEAQIAAQIRPDDPVVQLFLGYALINAGHLSDGIDHLRQATTVDPYYSIPYYYLGQALEQLHNDTAAVSAYRGYLAHAGRREGLRQSAQDAIDVLSMSKSPPVTH
jgi:predicted Zn-dependent protease